MSFLWELTLVGFHSISSYFPHEFIMRNFMRISRTGDPHFRLRRWRAALGLLMLTVRILGNLVCLFNNSSWIWAGITKFAPNRDLGILLSGIENRGHWPWPSRSFWPFWLRILGNSNCPHNNSSQIWARITQFAPNMHPGILSWRNFTISPRRWKSTTLVVYTNSPVGLFVQYTGGRLTIWRRLQERSYNYKQRNSGNKESVSIQ